jgi:uncharacterized protein YndB with AHSA1/START domain
MNTTTHPVSLKVTRLIKASRERVFAAWTDPNQIALWLCPGSRQDQSAEIDLRVGGEYHITMKAEECGEVDLHGVYREVTPPSRLVFTWHSSHCSPAQAETLVTVDLVERKDGTEVQITHEGFPNAEVRDRHSYGWSGSLDNLEKQV